MKKPLHEKPRLLFFMQLNQNKLHKCAVRAKTLLFFTYFSNKFIEQHSPFLCYDVCIRREEKKGPRIVPWTLGWFNFLQILFNYISILQFFVNFSPCFFRSRWLLDVRVIPIFKISLPHVNFKTIFDPFLFYYSPF